MPDRSPVGGFAIHVLTAMGAACALLALMAAVDARWSAMFAWLGVALVIDGIDGPLARMLAVADTVPRWSGETLDLVVDFTTYVFVPAFAIATGRLLPEGFEIAAGVVIVVTGALYFADREMKGPDNHFHGFPGLWNIVAFYLLLVRPPPGVAAALVVVLAGLTFVPFRFIHPVRVKRWRRFNLGVTGLSGVLAVVAIASDMAPPGWMTMLLCAIGLYVCVAGLFHSPPPA